MAYPTGSKVMVPEIGPDIYIVFTNPWLLPMDKPLPKHLQGDDADPDKVTAELERLGRIKLALMVQDWNLPDADGNPLPTPRTDATVYDRCPSIVFVKYKQAIDGMEVDHAWDPTQRPKTDATLTEKALTPKSSLSETSTETSTTTGSTIDGTQH